MTETRECRLCHRIGWRQFVAVGAEGWECANDRACKRRLARRVDVDTLNRGFVAVITRKGITQPEYDEATALYRAEDVAGLHTMITEAAVHTY